MRRHNGRLATAAGAGAMAGAAIAAATTLGFGGVWSSGARASPQAAGDSGGAREATAPDSSALRTARGLAEAFTAVADHVATSVVSLRVERHEAVPRRLRRGPHRAPRGDGDGYNVRRGAGSGLIIRPDGHVLTNHHVVARASEIDVVLHDGRHLVGEVIGIDPPTDLAVVKVEASGLPTLRFADSDEVRVGQWVLAMGSPFGLDYTATVGVVSAKGRAVGAAEIEDHIQTDASINPGNSGGPLVNLRGEVVGINTVIVGPATGIGFAVPSSLAQSVADELIESGAVRRPWIGVAFQALTPGIARQLELEDPDGALVSALAEGGPAEEAGLGPGDVILAVDGESVEDASALLQHVLGRDIGDVIALSVARDGEELTVEVELGERPLPEPEQAHGRESAEPGDAALGLRLHPLTDVLARRLGAPDATGAVVADVVPGSPAQRAGLRRGDIIVEADKQEVGDPAAVLEQLDDGEALLQVRRRRLTVFIVMEQ